MPSGSYEGVPRVLDARPRLLGVALGLDQQGHHVTDPLTGIFNRGHHVCVPMIDASKTYSVSEASELMGVCGETIRLKIKNKKLDAARIDRGPWQIAGASLAKMMSPMLELQLATTRTDREKNNRARQILAGFDRTKNL